MRPLMIPEYYSDFQCIGGACEDTCCAGWRVAVDKETYQKYRKASDKEMRDLLTKNVKKNRKSNSDSHYARFIMDEKNACSMLLDNGLCKIHKELGESYLCNTCVTYPRHITQVENVIEKSLTLSCPEAARLVLLKENGIDFIETEEPKDTRGSVVDQLSLKKAPYFWDLRIFIIGLMQNRQHSVESRLILLGLFLQKVEEIPQVELKNELQNLMQDFSGRLNNLDYITSLEQIEGNLHFQLNLAKELIRYRLSAGMGMQKYLDLLKELLKGLDLEDDDTVSTISAVTEKSILKYQNVHQNIYRPFMETHEYILENYVVNYIFKNLFPYDYETLFESYIMLILQVVLIKIHVLGLAANRNKLSPDMFVLCVQQLAKVIEHDPEYLSGVRDAVNQSGYNTMAHMFVVIKS